MLSPRLGVLLAVLVVVARVLSAAHSPDVIDAGLGTMALLCAVALRRTPDPLPLVLAAVGVFFVVGVLGSSHPRVSLWASPAIVGLVGFFLIGQRMREHAGLAFAFAGACLLHTGLMTHQRFVSWPAALAAPPAGAAQSTLDLMSALRPVGFSLSPDLAGGLCLLGAGVWLTLALRGGGARRWGALIGALLCLGGAWVSRSNGVILVGAFGLWWFFVARTKSRALLAGVLAVPLGLLLGRGFDALAHSAGERLANWGGALSMFSARPLTGWGWARFGHGYSQFRAPGSNETLYAHSTPLTWLAEGGLWGALMVVLLAALAGALVRAAWRADDDVDRLWPVLGLAGLLRTVIDYDGQVAQTASAIALVAGAGLGPSARVHKSSLAALGAALALCLGVTLGLGVRDTALASFDDDAEALLDYAPHAGSDPEVLVAAATVQMSRARACQAEPPASVAQQHCATANAAAEAALDAAVAVHEPVPIARVLAGQWALQQGRPAKAQALAEQALTLAPGSTYAHELRIQALRARGLDPGPALDEAADWLSATRMNALRGALSPAPPRR